MSLGNVTTFRLDMSPGRELPVIHASAGDIGRAFKAYLYWDGEGYTPASGITAELTGIYQDGTVPPEPGTATITDNYVTFVLPEAFCAISGKLDCEIRLKKDDDVIGSGNFWLMVERGWSENSPAVEYQTVISAITDATAQAEGYAAQAQDAATSASGSATAAASSAAAAAVSEQNAFSGTPDGYAALVNTVNRLSDNTSATSAFMPFPKDVLANNTDINNVLIGDWYCATNATRKSLLNLPSGVGSVFRLQVISITRDGATAPAESVPWIRRVQLIVDSNGPIFLRFGYREGSATSFIWGAWTKVSSYAPPSAGSPTLASGWSADVVNFYETADAWCHICSRLTTSSAVSVSNGFIFATGYPKPRSVVFFNAVTNHDQLVQCVIDINGTLKSYWPTANGTSLVANTVVDFDVTYRLA